MSSQMRLYLRPPGENLVTELFTGAEISLQEALQSSRQYLIMGNHSGTGYKAYRVVHTQTHLPSAFPAHFGVQQRTEPCIGWQDAYRELVIRGVEHILAGNLTKVVLASSCRITAPVAPASVFGNLLAQHPDACCFLLESPLHGIWLGASPERLFKQQGDKLELMALAGTRGAGSESVWGAKELEEQHIVQHNILEELQWAGYQGIEVSAPVNRRSGAMEHICTLIHADAKGRENWLPLLQRLHPTPALSGYPKAQALEFIHGHEPFERELFTGFFGLGCGSDIDLTIMIRCAKYNQGAYTLFAGAGINRDSDPDREVLELRAKFGIMEQAIRGEHLG